MRTRIFALIAIAVSFVNAQTETIVDPDGNTIIENITLNPLGIPTTQTLASITPQVPGVPAAPGVPGGVASTSSLATTSIASTSSTTSISSTTPLTTTTTTPINQGPYPQPQPTQAQGSISYRYTTTDALGDTTVIDDVFTPSFPPTQTPNIPTTGTVLDYSQWLSLVGTNTVAPPQNGAVGWSPGADRQWVGVSLAVLSGVVGGACMILPL